MKRIDLLLKKVGLVPVTNHPLMASTTHTVFVFAYISNVFFPSLFPHLNILKGTNKIHMIEDCLTRFHSHRISFIFRPTFRRSSRPLASRSEQGLSHQTSTHFFFRFWNRIYSSCGIQRDAHAAYSPTILFYLLWIWFVAFLID